MSAGNRATTCQVEWTSNPLQQTHVRNSGDLAASMQLELNGPKFILPSFLETWHPDIKKKKKNPRGCFFKQTKTKTNFAENEWKTEHC